MAVVSSASLLLRTGICLFACSVVSGERPAMFCNAGKHDTSCLSLLQRVIVVNKTSPLIGHQNTSNATNQVPLLDVVPPELRTPRVFIPVMLGFSLMVLVLTTFFRSLCNCGRRRQPLVEGQRPQWSLLGIMCLTSFRFYTGFLSATWMPYLLAMEGEMLVGERQAIFMGTSKLIYGMSILLNPVFGLLGDRLNMGSRWSGRRMFVILGVGCSSLGIYGCIVGSEVSRTDWYLIGTVLWMVGEAMADVTTETLVPELVFPEQHGIASAIRGLNFLLGGIAGYTLLITFRDIHYSWLYYGYLVIMFVCALMSLCAIGFDDEAKASSDNNTPNDLGMAELLSKSYIQPARLPGGFPLASLAVFVFSLGSAPMFFLLLMVRDVIGITDRSNQQYHFGFISMIFFLGAAATSVLLASKSSNDQAGGQGRQDDSHGMVESKLPPPKEKVMMQIRSTMLTGAFLFGVVEMLIPAVAIFPTVELRTVVFYLLATAFGVSFGCVYCKFQECTWLLLPDGADVANSMGFAAMSKLAGVGLGNFCLGGVLDVYAKKGGGHDFGGHVALCFLSGSFVMLSVYLISLFGPWAVVKSDDHAGAQAQTAPANSECAK
eukprot:TRINITY_DN75143_c0_g1_i1.p1 TRINITY_DN75143_c0_g1~~TRINITY_DN75143_c0_g1_i1.p1  ORF type:complete len:603 (-),score=84.27 TRINITY_DN75143_c0_g1_i1:50-1858(-)